MNRELFEKEKGFVQLVKWSGLLYGIAMIALGVLLILYPDDVVKLIGFIIGAAAFAYGAMRLILYFAFERKSSLMARGLFAAIFFIAAGIYLFALFTSEEDPLSPYRAIAHWAKVLLAPKGFGIVEINEHFSEETAAVFRDEGFEKVEIIPDFYEKFRFVLFEKRL